MAGVNKAIIVGYLGNDPEMKHTPGGASVVNFSVATSESWKDKQSGEKQTRTEWHRVIAWNKLGEICDRYLAKGSQVYIEGKLQTRSWEKDGVTRYVTEIVATNVTFLGDGGGTRTDSGRRERDDPYQPAMGTPSGPFNDDIPF